MKIVPAWFASICLLAFLSSPLPAQTEQAPAEQKSLVGTWSGTDNRGEAGTLVLNADGSADMIRNGVSLKESVVKTNGTITYRFSAESTPAQFDFTVARSDGKLLTMLGIAEFQPDGALKVRLVRSGTRPVDFNGPPEETILLRKKED